MYLWKDEDGTVQGAAWTEEYDLYVDFVHGIRVDLSPNFFTIRRGESHVNPENPEWHDDPWMEYEELIETWQLNDPEVWHYASPENNEPWTEQMTEMYGINFETATFEEFSAFVQREYDKQKN